MQSYEISLVGSFPHSDLTRILQRCTLQSNTSRALNWREVTFEPLGSTPATRADPSVVRVVCRKDREKDTAGWAIYSYSKPEPSRDPKNPTVRQTSVVDVHTGSAMAFVSALGYQKVEEVRKQGYEFQRGRILIHIFRTESVDRSTTPPTITPAPPDAPFHIEVTTLTPIKSSVASTNETQAPMLASAGIREHVEAVFEFKGVMKGLLDLGPRPALTATNVVGAIRM